MSLSQRARSLAVTTPLGEDVLLLRAMQGRERLSTLFKYHLDLISESSRPIRHEELLGQPVTVRLELPDHRTRYFNGIVSRFSDIGSAGRLTHYRATLVPWLWLLTRTTDCRIFQEQTVPDIVKAICRERGYSDFEEFLVEPHHSRSYCVQYRETDFDFISRLLEQEGIYYFFRHEKDRHTLVLTDDYGAHRPVAGYEEIPYYPPSETALRERDHIDDWSVTGAVRSGAFTHTDFNFKAPRSNLRTGRNHPHEQARWDLEVYDYPGGYTRDDQGDDWARARIEELHAGYETARGKGNARGLTTGAHFKLSNYPYFNPDPARCLREDPNREYLVVSAKYRLQSDAFGTASAVGATGATDTGPVFRCKFTALDAQTPFRPPRVTKKPHVKGPQTAIVVGYGDQEIRTDQYGRVKVQFHWDRYGQSDEKSSCWIRVAHPWAGKGWGAIAIPRVGQEVIVEFLEGDPDRPIITGGVYNAANKPPYQLPGNAAISGLKSSSTKGGGGYNEYVMDDTKGNERIREHGQFDKDSTIEHDLREQVRHDRSRDVTHNETIQVGNDRAKAVGGNETSAIGGDREEKVGGTVALTAQNLIIEAGTSITLKVGSGYLVVDQSGVTVSNAPPNAPVINRSSSPLAWMGKLLEGNIQAPFVAEQSGQDDLCAKDAIRNVTECCGSEIFAAAKEALGKDPTIEFGIPPDGSMASSNPKTGKITIHKDADRCPATERLFFELANVTNRGKFGQVHARAESGELGREEYVWEIERVEYDSLQKTFAAIDKCKDKWGCGSYDSKSNRYRGASGFEEHYNERVPNSHKDRYRKQWDKRYKADYEAKHPPGN